MKDSIRTRQVAQQRHVEELSFSDRKLAVLLLDTTTQEKFFSLYFQLTKTPIATLRLTITNTKMATQLMEESMRSNNEGVAHAAYNHVDQAADQFCKSLRIAQHLLRASPDYNDIQASPARTYASQRGKGTGQTGFHHSAHATRSIQAGPSSFFVYQKALILESNTSSSMANENLSHRLCTYSAATCFNLALLYHQEGMNTGRSQLIHKAEQMYSACLKILRDGNLSHLNPTTLLITVAASNNLAEIMFSKCMVLEASHHIHYVEWLIYECQVVNLDLFNSEEIHGFLGNILHRKGINTAAAA